MSQLDEMRPTRSMERALDALQEAQKARERALRSLRLSNWALGFALASCLASFIGLALILWRLRHG